MIEVSSMVQALSALAHADRLEAFRLLVKAGPSGMASGEIAAALGVPPTRMSFHLAALERSGLLISWRDGRRILYAVGFEEMRRLLTFLTEDCCDGHPEICGGLAAVQDACPQVGGGTVMASKQNYNVLFLCTGNSARSILAEAILAREGMGRFRAFSAGSQPKGEVHPYSLDLLKKLNHDTSFARSKNWDEFAEDGAPVMDFVFTVCDQAASESCPVWPGQPMSAHWGVPDPAAAEGSEAERRFAFADAYRMLSNRISIFINLPIDSIDRLALQKQLDEIGSLSENTAA